MIVVMSSRTLIVDIDPAAPPMVREVPLIMRVLGPGRASVPLDGVSPEEALAELLASGVAVRGSRVVEER
jgi:hypothetical protein